MRILYEFKHKNPATEEIEILAIRKPTRLELDEIDIMRSQFFSECVNRGILTKEMLQKSYKDFGGPLSKEESEEYTKILEEFLTSGQKLDAAKTKKTKEKWLEKRMNAFSALQAIELKNEELFSRTADFISETKTITYLVLLLSVKQDGEKWKSIFPQANFEDRYLSYCKMEESEHEVARALFEHLYFLVSFWYSSGSSITTDDFIAYESLSEYKVYDDIESPEELEQPVE